MEIESEACMLAPDVGTLVEYGLNGLENAPARYRVSSWMRAAPPPKLDPDDFLGDILFESCRELEDEADGKKKRMQFCLREEATHVSLSGICGAIAPIAMCKIVGKVDWPVELLNLQRESAVRFGTEHTMLF
jgi:hypothetical protein